MKKDKSIFSALGIIYTSIGFIGTAAITILLFLMQPQHRIYLFAGAVFATFLLLGVLFLFIGRRRESQIRGIRENGIKVDAIVIKILKRYGSRPVRMGSRYCAEVELAIDNQRIHSRMFFIGKDFAKMEECIRNKHSIAVVYYEKFPQQVLPFERISD